MKYVLFDKGGAGAAVVVGAGTNSTLTGAGLKIAFSQM